MARMNGVEPQQAGWMTRLVYWLARRKVGALTGDPRLVEPVKIHAHHPRLLKGYGQMEMAQQAANAVPAALKSLASILTDMLIGCPY